MNMVVKKHKNSGMEWIDSIPADWSIIPLHAVVRPKKIKGGSGELLSVYLDRGVINASDGTLGTHAPSVDLSGYQQVSPGDFILNNQQAWRGSVGVSFLSGMTSPAYLILGLKPEMEWRYANYLLRSLPMVDQYNLSSQGVGTIQKQLYAPAFRKVIVVVPPKVIQEKIADYLDIKTAAIDQVIEKKKRMIELLKEKRTSIITHAVTKGLDPNAKMRDSGVEWIDEIPEGWGVKRAMFVYNQVSRKPLENDEIITAFRDGQVTLRKNRREDGFTNAIVEAGYQHIEPGDLVIHGMDGFAGAIGVSDSVGKSSPVYSVCVPVRVNESAPGYHAYLLRHMASSNFILAQARGIRERSTEFRFKEFRKNNLLMPNYEEQVMIAEYLDTVSIKINSCINQVQAQIERLTEYRASLIYHAVTGKMSV